MYFVDDKAVMFFYVIDDCFVKREVVGSNPMRTL